MNKRLIFSVLFIAFLSACNKENPTPSLPDSVTIQVISINLDTKTAGLVATQPTSGITGLWTIESNNEVEGSFSNDSDPLATFTGSYFDVYVIRWTLTNGVENKFAEVTVQISSESSLLELVEEGIPIEELIEQGYSPLELFLVGVSIDRLLEANLSVGELYSLGIEVTDLMEAGITVEQLIVAEVSTSNLLSAGISLEELVEAGVPVSDLLTAEVSILDLYNSGVSIDELEDNGITLNLLVEAGIPTEALINEDYSIEELIEAGVNINSLLVAGISIIALYNSGISIAELINANVTIEELLQAGIPLSEFLSNGVTVPQLLDAGVSLPDLLNEGVTALELYDAGILVGELKQNGVQDSELEQAGLIGLVNDIENNIYEWVKIGDQIWFSENLASTQFTNGTTINSAQAPANDESNVEIYGRLYNWNDATNNICPDGWHLPSENEWQQLFTFLGDNAGSKMKTTGTLQDGNGLWEKDDPGDEGTNSSGFNGVPSAPSGNLRERVQFWTSTERDNSTAWRPELIFLTSGVGYSYSNKSSGLSCRCLKD